MNKFSAHRTKRASSLKNYIHGTFIRHKAGTLWNALIIHLGRAILLARRWRVRHKLLSIQLAPVHLSTGKGPTGTFDADGALDDFEPWTGLHQPPHQAEVAPRQSLSRPQPNYEALHGMFGHLVELDQLLQLVAQGHRVSGLSILRPEHLLRRAALLGSIECGGIGYTPGKICKCPGELRIRVSNK